MAMEEWRNPVHPDTRRALDDAWARVPDSLRTPRQFLGRQYAGCGALIGAMPRCDFACRGCYLSGDANRIPAAPLEEIDRQLQSLRRWLGEGGGVQITDGEVALRDRDELLWIVKRARALGLIPMLFTHGDGILRDPSLLRRLMVGRRPLGGEHPRRHDAARTAGSPLPQRHARAGAAPAARRIRPPDPTRARRDRSPARCRDDRHRDAGERRRRRRGRRLGARERRRVQDGELPADCPGRSDRGRARRRRVGGARLEAHRRRPRSARQRRARRGSRELARAPGLLPFRAGRRASRSRRPPLHAALSPRRTPRMRRSCRA